MPRDQLILPFGPIRNSNLFSNHWLENRLGLEPEWNELREEAQRVLDGLKELWAQQSSRVEHYEKEQTLEFAFIRPVLTMLGWKPHYQPHLRGRAPDYALFLDDASQDAALKAGVHSPDFWKCPVLLADAKAWTVSLDRPSGGGKAREYPPQQIEWYLNESQLPFAILTNGRLWRLIPRRHDADQPRFETYFECNLAELLRIASGRPAKTNGTSGGLFEPLDLFMRFYLFFSPAGFRAIEGRMPFVQRAAIGSSEYRLGVGEGLKERVFEALRICIEGFIAHAPNGLDPKRDLPACRANSFTLLYRLLFIMYAEDRGLLPYGINKAYTENRSLRRHRDEIAEALHRVELRGEHADYPPGSTAIWDDLGSLFDLIDSGRKTYGVPAYNGGLFDPAGHPFLFGKAIPDRYLARVIDQLGRAVDKEHPEAGLFRVDYRDLAIQHLGSIYEGLLELHPYYAVEPMDVIRREGREGGEERTQPARENVPRGFEVVAAYKTGQVYLLNNKGERRASGSYYTPNHIVDYIVERALGPLCRGIDEHLEGRVRAIEGELATAVGERRKALQEELDTRNAEFDDRVLRLKVCDPAMGSGHFLIRVCQYLAEEIATNPRSGDPDVAAMAGDESTLTFWKRRIVEHCIYGVDLNAVAVELAKLALWLETAAIDQPLTFLDHHLRCGNSLVGAAIESIEALHGDKIGGKGLFAARVQGRLPAMLQAVSDIAAMPSETVPQVKEKERLYRKVLEPVREPLQSAADAWCSPFFAPKGKGISQSDYQGLLNALDEPARLRKLVAQPAMAAHLAAARQEAVNAFHWQLAFPEVFFDGTGLREDGGFDAVVGNPPYDVLSEKETGHDLSALKRFLKAQPIYSPSFRGKNNLYKLFVCRAAGLLADGGRLGFITPMAILGDDQAADLRRMMFSVGAFTSVDAFPQKDDPRRRVFPEAKLSTAVFTLKRNGTPEHHAEPFVSRVHPADQFEPDSPSLLLTTAGIPAYDPENLTIVSCSQADWDLAIRIISSGRMKRLGEFCTSYQGEVNETNDRSAGSISYDPAHGPEAMRGAHLCLYALRSASQGKPVYVKTSVFLEGVTGDTKKSHYQYARVGFQRKSPQNNFRRLIGAMVPRGVFLVESISYIPEHQCNLPLGTILAILNSKLAEWYFRLGSSNAMIGEYQLHNLPCPAFAEKPMPADRKMQAEVTAVLDVWAGGTSRKAGPADPEKMIREVCGILQPAMAKPPYGRAVRDTIIELVGRIAAIEKRRGEISRSDRSALALAAQPYQELIDRIFYQLAGLSEADWRGLEERLAKML